MPLITCIHLSKHFARDMGKTYKTVACIAFVLNQHRVYRTNRPENFHFSTVMYLYSLDHFVKMYHLFRLTGYLPCNSNRYATRTRTVIFQSTLVWPPTLLQRFIFPCIYRTLKSRFTEFRNDIRLLPDGIFLGRV